MLERVAETAARSGQASSLLAAVNHPDSAFRLRVLGLADKHGVDVSESLRDAANKALSNNGASEKEQLAALELIHHASPSVIESAVKRLMKPSTSSDFRVKVINAVLKKESKIGAKVLMDHLPRTTPRLASVMIEELLAYNETTKKLLKKGKIVKELKNTNRYTYFPSPKSNSVSHVRPHARNAKDTFFFLVSKSFLIFSSLLITFDNFLGLLDSQFF